MKFDYNENLLFNKTAQLFIADVGTQKEIWRCSGM